MISSPISGTRDEARRRVATSSSRPRIGAALWCGTVVEVPTTRAQRARMLAPHLLRQPRLTHLALLHQLRGCPPVELRPLAAWASRREAWRVEVLVMAQPLT